MLKQHNKTKLKYLCKCSTNNIKYCYSYCGSDKYWKRHLKKHGKDITTTILGIYDTNEELAVAGAYYSKLWNVVENKEFANLIPETGQGGFSKEAIKAAHTKEATEKRIKIWKEKYSGQTKYDSERVAKMATTKSGRYKKDYDYIKNQAEKISKGIYHTPFGNFVSPEDAARYLGVTAVSSIRKACTTNVNKVISKYAATVVKWWKLIEGKTYGELGFGFTAK